MGSPEVQVRFDRDRLARLGLEESEVANMLRNKIRGDVASRYREEDKQIEILVRAGEQDRGAVDDIRNLLIVRNQQGRGPLILDPQMQMLDAGARESQIRSTPADQQRPLEANPQQRAPLTNGARAVPVRLGAVAGIVTGRGPSEVRRIRSQRAAVVSANLSGRDLRSVSEDIRVELQKLRTEIPATTTIGLGGQNEELNASFRSLVLALGLAIFLVYLVMASQFESLVHPFLILFAVPLGGVGVILALALTRTPFSVMVFLGVIILAGIVVNNAIVLVDYTNQLRGEGLSVREALVRAGDTRLRPIVMTTLTTVLGLIPMAIGWGEGAEIRAPMAITVIGGLTFSTLLTLVFIPVIYELVNRETQP
jgi:HAE1 family hydrophobic/amphiphilic exporter-1